MKKIKFIAYIVMIAIVSSFGAIGANAENDTTKPEIIAVNEVTSITPIGKKPQLPKKVTVLLSNGKKKEVSVTWDNVDEDTLSEEGDTSISGVVYGTDINASANILVRDIEDDYVSNIYYPNIISFTGETPKLPDDVEVLYSDNTKGTLKVKWNLTGLEDYSEAGVVTVDGKTFAGSFGVKLNVQVIDKVLIDLLDVSVSTKVKVVPKLPTTVKALYEGGIDLLVPVKWDSISSSQYGKKGSFKVTGTVAGTDKKVVAEITVN